MCLCFQSNGNVTKDPAILSLNILQVDEKHTTIVSIIVKTLSLKPQKVCCLVMRGRRLTHIILEIFRVEIDFGCPIHP